MATATERTLLGGCDIVVVSAAAGEHAHHVAGEAQVGDRRDDGADDERPGDGQVRPVDVAEHGYRILIVRITAQMAVTMFARVLSEMCSIGQPFVAMSLNTTSSVGIGSPNRAT